MALFAWSCCVLAMAMGHGHGHVPKRTGPAKHIPVPEGVSYMHTYIHTYIHTCIQYQHQTFRCSYVCMVWNANCRNVLKTFRLKPKIDMPRGGPVLPDTVAKGAPAVKSKAAPKGKASAKPKAQRRRYYAVTRVMQENDNRLLGIHHCQWSVLDEQLPTGHYIGSSSQLAGYDTLDGAVKCWLDAGWALPAPYFEPPAPYHHI